MKSTLAWPATVTGVVMLACGLFGMAVGTVLNTHYLSTILMLGGVAVGVPGALFLAIGLVLYLAQWIRLRRRHSGRSDLR